MSSSTSALLTKATRGCVRWVLERYEPAGLTAPTPRSVRFTEYSDLCNDAKGRARRNKDGWHLYFCIREAELCPNGNRGPFASLPQHVMLHELAHV